MLINLQKTYENIAARKHSIEETNVSGNRFINEAKTLNAKMKSYKDSLDDSTKTGELAAKRLRKVDGGVEVVQKELDYLNNEYKSLLNQVLSLLNQLQDDETRMREFVSFLAVDFNGFSFLILYLF